MVLPGGGKAGSHRIHGSLGLYPSIRPKWHLDCSTGSTVSAGLTVVSYTWPQNIGDNRCIIMLCIAMRRSNNVPYYTTLLCCSFVCCFSIQVELTMHLRSLVDVGLLFWVIITVTVDGHFSYSQLLLTYVTLVAGGVGGAIEAAAMT